MSVGNASTHDLLQQAHGLSATTVELDGGALMDLVRAGGSAPGHRLWAQHDVIILAVGQALLLPLPSPWAGASTTSVVDEVLNAITIAEAPGNAGPDQAGTDQAGTGPIAIGALPFDIDKGGHLVVPRLSICRRGSRAWATLVSPRQAGGPPPEEALLAAVAALSNAAEQANRDGLPPDGFELRASMSHEHWKGLIERTVEEMQGGHLDKVVMARRVDVVANRPFVLPDVLSRLVSLYPSCTVFHVAGFIGASPELLLRRSGYEVASHPLAGTIARSGDVTTDDEMLQALMASPKERHEHGVVVDEIAARLAPFCSTLEVPAAPSALMLRNVSHLGTSITGKLTDHQSTGHESTGHESAGRPPTALQLAALLHPTPAVGGVPRAEALRWQQDNEGFDRGFYAGPVGWVDSRGDGEWAVGVRCAQVSGQKASLYAGNGIVAGSRAEAELAETQLKLQALLSALVRP